MYHQVCISLSQPDSTTEKARAAYIYFQCVGVCMRTCMYASQYVVCVYCMPLSHIIYISPDVALLSMHRKLPVLLAIAKGASQVRPLEWRFSCAGCESTEIATEENI